MTDFNKKEFQDICNKIIGENTKAAFAEKIGISRAYFQALLSEKSTKPPSKEVVLKIAQEAADPMDSVRLLSICG